MDRWGVDVSRQLTDSYFERLMEHDVPRKAVRRKAKFPLNTTPPRCVDCKKQPPACECRRADAG